MSELRLRSDKGWRALSTALGLLAGFLLLTGTGMGRDADTKSGPGAAAGKCVDPSAPVLRRARGAETWAALKPPQLVNDGDELVALGRGTIESKNGAVRLTLLGNVIEAPESPVLEAAVVVRNSPDADLDFTLQRGRVLLANHKGSGPARVRFQFGDQKWELGLADKDSAVAVELYSYWPRGVPFAREPKAGHGPITDLYGIVLRGQADLKTASQQFALNKGLLYHWNSASGADPGPQRLAKVPEWTEPQARPTTAEGKKRLTALEQLHTRVVNQPVRSALAQPIVESVDPAEREMGVYGLAAVDDLQRLVLAFGDEKHADVRAAAVGALRHWIGRGPDQDRKLYDSLVQQSKFTPGQAEIVLQLLHSFSDQDLNRPETFETLIAYLGSSRPQVRELANWHLTRIVPAGKSIKYDAGASKEDREKAAKAWKQLIPDGKLPPAPKAEGK